MASGLKTEKGIFQLITSYNDFSNQNSTSSNTSLNIPHDSNVDLQSCKSLESDVENNYEGEQVEHNLSHCVIAVMP